MKRNQDGICRQPTAALLCAGLLVGLVFVAPVRGADRVVLAEDIAGLG